MILENLDGNGLIIHHWDTDGICSGAILLDNLQRRSLQMDTFTPSLGNYYLLEKELKELKKLSPKFIIIADLCLPKYEVLKLKEITPKIIIFDHHAREEIFEVMDFNPISKGEIPEKYPATTWILDNYLNTRTSLLSVLGVFGDNGLGALTNKFVSDRITEFIRERNLTPEILIKITNLIDSNYQLGDRTGVMNALYFVLENKNSADKLLECEKWNKNVERLYAEVNKYLERPGKEIGNIVIKKINTKYHLSSKIGRAIAWSGNKKIAVVINTGISNDSDEIYVRSGIPTVDLLSILSIAKHRNYQAGGKKDVISINLPKSDTAEFVSEILSRLDSSFKKGEKIL